MECGNDGAYRHHSTVPSSNVAAATTGRADVKNEPDPDDDLWTDMENS